MKKIGFIALALVTLLATLGIGFSMWSQTVTITGQVNTGNVTLQVSNFTGTWAYKDANSALQFVNTLPPGWTAVTNALWVGSSAVVSSVQIGNGALTTIDYTGGAGQQTFACTSDGSLTLNLTYSNLFPVPSATAGQFRPWTADFDVKNTGSIPVKLEVGTFSTTNSISTVTPGTMTYAVTYTNGGGSTIAAEGKQLEPGDIVHVAIGFTVDETTTQNYSGSFSLNVSAVQWNEYIAGVGGTVPRVS